MVRKSKSFFRFGFVRHICGAAQRPSPTIMFWCVLSFRLCLCRYSCDPFPQCAHWGLPLKGAALHSKDLKRRGEFFSPQRCILVSVDKGKHGFDGQKCVHTSSKPLTIRQYSPRPFHRLATFLLRQNCFAPDRDGFSSDFCFLRRRRAAALQDEKDKKRR